MRAVRARQPVRLLVALVAVGLVATACRYTSRLPLPTQQAVSSQILWADGSVLTTLHDAEDRDPVTLAQMAPTLPKAVVAIEDERFYQHDGVDARGVVRALTHDIEAGDVVEGGSTITQQYVRAVMLGREKSLERKVREAVMAVQLEQRYSKRTILTRYLNTVYFGNGAYGVQAAARTYFGKDAKDLDLAQSALLAGLIRAPSAYDPYVAPDLALARRNAVLDKLAALGREPADVVALTRATPLQLAPRARDDRYPAAHFVKAVRELIVDNPAFGVNQDQRRRLLLEGGLRIHTTLDPRWQLLAEQAISRVITKPETDPAAALVALDPTTGAVKAYVGGPDFFGAQPWAQVDLAGGGCRADGSGCRQSGSTFKPFVLAAALQAGIPLDRTYDAPGTITLPPTNGETEPWTVRNYDGTGSGQMDLTEATVKSVNTVYAQLVTDVGPQAVVSTAHAMGITSSLEAVRSAALGSNGVTPLEMASAYDTLAGDGLHAPPVLVSRVTTRDGTVLYEAPTTRPRVLPADTARTITGVLQQGVERGTGVNARIGRPVAGKTGTATSWYDAWFVGYTPELVASVWVGFPDSERSMLPPATRTTVTGGSWPAQIWQQFAGAALAETPATPFPVPAPPAAPTTTTTVRPGLISVVGLTGVEATRALVDAGFRVRTVGAPSRAQPPGIVLAQSPAAGRPVRPGSQVTITIANGPPAIVAVPSVLDLLADEAATALRAAGLAVDVKVQAEPPPGNPARAGRTWKQSPAAGTAVDAGSAVTVWVNP
jgi:penicillin-binding protein 1A